MGVKYSEDFDIIRLKEEVDMHANAVLICEILIVLLYVTKLFLHLQ